MLDHFIPPVQNFQVGITDISSPKNWKFITNKPSPAPAVWAAWGNIIEERQYLPLCVRDMAEAGGRYGARWYTAGTRSRRGHPHHPLYLRKDSPLEEFDVEAYCGGL